jgi:hypothetical protein
VNWMTEMVQGARVGNKAAPDAVPQPDSRQST